MNDLGATFERFFSLLSVDVGPLEGIVLWATL